MSRPNVFNRTAGHRSALTAVWTTTRRRNPELLDVRVWRERRDEVFCASCVLRENIPRRSMLRIVRRVKEVRIRRKMRMTTTVPGSPLAPERVFLVREIPTRRNRRRHSVRRVLCNELQSRGQRSVGTASNEHITIPRQPNARTASLTLLVLQERRWRRGIWIRATGEKMSTSKKSTCARGECRRVKEAPEPPATPSVQITSPDVSVPCVRRATFSQKSTAGAGNVPIELL